MTSNLLFQRTLYPYYMLKYRRCYSIIKMFVITEIKGEVKKQYCITSIGLLNLVCRHRKKSHQHEASLHLKNQASREKLVCTQQQKTTFSQFCKHGSLSNVCVPEMFLWTCHKLGGFSESCAFSQEYQLTCARPCCKFFSSIEKKPCILSKDKKILLLNTSNAILRLGVLKFVDLFFPGKQLLILFSMKKQTKTQGNI